jgi:hypothetical protein
VLQVNVDEQPQLAGTRIILAHIAEVSGCRAPVPFRAAAWWHQEVMAQDLEVGLWELFFGKEELLPLWFRLRSHVEAFGDDVRVRLRGRYAEFDRGGLEFVIAEPTADHELEVGLHNPGLPFDERFREAVAFGSRRITHRVSLPEDSVIDDELHARLHAAYALARAGEPR